jgi:hypothetical protein
VTWMNDVCGNRTLGGVQDSVKGLGVWVDWRKSRTRLSDRGVNWIQLGYWSYKNKPTGVKSGDREVQATIAVSLCALTWFGFWRSRPGSAARQHTQAGENESNSVVRSLTLVKILCTRPACHSKV